MAKFQKLNVPQRLLKIFNGEKKKLDHPKKLLADPETFIKYILSGISDVEGVINKKSAKSYTAITEVLAQIMASASDDAPEIAPHKATQLRKKKGAHAAASLVAFWVDHDDPEPTAKGIKDDWSNSACAAALENLNKEITEYVDAWARLQLCRQQNPLDDLFGGSACSGERSSMNAEWHDVEVALQMLEIACANDMFG